MNEIEGKKVSKQSRRMKEERKKREGMKTLIASEGKNVCVRL